MIDTLILALSLVFSVTIGTVGIGLIVRGVEHGKTERCKEEERTKRAAINGAWEAEQNRGLELKLGALSEPSVMVPFRTKEDKPW